MDYDTTVNLLGDILQRSKGGKFILLSQNDDDDWKIADLRRKPDKADANEDLVPRLQALLGTSQSTPPPVQDLINFDSDDEDDGYDEEQFHDQLGESEESQGLDELSDNLKEQGSEDFQNLISIFGSQSRSPPAPDLMDESQLLISWDETTITSIPSVPKSEYVNALQGIQLSEPSELDLGDAKLWGDRPTDEFDEQDRGRPKDTLKAGQLFTPLKRADTLVPFSPRRLRKRGLPAQSQESINDDADEEAVTEEAGEEAEDGEAGNDEIGFLDQTVYDLDLKSPHKKVFRSTVTSAKSTLCELPFLTKHNLVYNNKYNVIICTICRQGVLFDMLYAHLTGGNKAITKVWDDNLAKYQEMKVRHMMVLGNREDWEDRLLRDLRTALKVSTLTPISSKESMKMTIKQVQNLLKPHAGDDTPVEGIDIKEYAYVCDVAPCKNDPFPYVSLALSTLERHVRPQANRVNEDTITHLCVPKQRAKWSKRNVAAQTIIMGSGYDCYFQVDPEKSPVSHGIVQAPSPSAPATTSDILDILRREANTLLGPSGLAGESASSASVLLDPAFEAMGMPELWSQVALSDVRTLLSLRPVQQKNATPKTQQLYRAITATFLSICDSVRQAHYGILSLIINGSLPQNSSKRRPFAVPQKAKTLEIYLLFEVQFLRHMIYFYNHPIYRISKSGAQAPVFCFNERQKANLKNLTEILHEGLAPLESVADAVMDTLHALYFPDSPENASFDVFSDVLVVYICLMCLTVEGSPVALSQIPVFLSKVQFSMRLRAYHHIYTISVGDAEHSAPAQLPKKPGRTLEETSTRTRTSRIPTRSRASRTQLLTQQPSTSTGTSAAPSTTRPRPTRSSTRVRSNTKASSSVVIPTLRKSSPASDHRDDNSEFDPNDSDSDSEGTHQPLGLGMKVKYDMEKETRRRAKELGPIDTPTRKTWYKNVMAWVDIYLTETNVSPYSSVRQFMHLSSVSQRNVRKMAFIQWKSPTVMLVDKHTFEVSQFIDFVQYQLDALEQFIKDEVLFGSSLDDLGIACDFKTLQDTKDVQTMGYGCLLSDGTPLNPDAERFYLHLQQQGKLFSVGSGGTEWDTVEAEVWVQSISLALKRLCVVCHILQGSPGRGTEELLMQISNSPSGRRHLFVDNIRGTLTIWSNYWKGAKVTGRFKEILRVFPYRPSRLLFTMVRIVRPVELLYHMKTLGKEEKIAAANNEEKIAAANNEEKIAAANNKEKIAAANAYHNMLWASRGQPPHPMLLVDGIPSFFRLKGRNGKKFFDWINGIRLYRHIVVALQRRHFPDSRYTKTIAGEQTNIGDLQAGRTGESSTQNYAPKHDIIPADHGLIDHYIAFSKRWHEFMKESTSFEEGRKYVV